MDKDIKGVIIGNKIDLEEKRVITKEDLEEIGNKFKMPVLEVSAKNGININESFDKLVDELFKNKSREDIIQSYLRKNKSDLSVSTKNSIRNQRGCCK